MFTPGISADMEVYYHINPDTGNFGSRPELILMSAIIIKFFVMSGHIDLSNARTTLHAKLNKNTMLWGQNNIFHAQQSSRVFYQINIRI